MADLDPKNLSKLRVIDLREHLSNRGLPTSGLKAELVKRLQEALLDEGENDGVQDTDEQDRSRDSDDNSSEMTDKSSKSSTSVENESCQIDEEEKMEVDNELEAEERLRIEAERKSEEDRLSIEAENKAAEEKARIEAEEERLRIEAERKAEEERLRIEAERKAEEERLRIEAERKAEEERLRIEAERKAEEERLRIEAERKEEEERLRIEAERKAEEERLRIEAERKAEEERLRIEAERKAVEERARIEVERKATEERARIEAERKAAEERARIEAERAAAEEKARIEAERKAAEERARVEAERKAAEERARVEAERIAEEDRLRILEERKAEEERLQIEAERKAEEERVRIDAQRKAETERLRIEAKRRAEEEQLRIEAQRKAEEDRIRILEEKKKAEVQRLEEEKSKAEEQKRIEERKKEEQRIRDEKSRLEEEERRKTEREKKIKEQRMAEEEEMKREQERWLVEEQMRKAQEEHRKRLKAEEKKRQLAEEQQKQEEQQMIVEKQQRLATAEIKKQKENEIDQSSSAKGISSTSSNAFSSSPTIIPPPPTTLMSNFPPPPPPPPMPLSNVLSNSNVSVAQGTSATKFSSIPFSASSMKSNPSGEFQILSENDVQELDLNFNSEESMDTTEAPSDIQLPQALEKVLALKTERAQQLGVDPDAVVQPDQVNEEKNLTPNKSTVVSLVSVDEDEFIDDENASNKNKDAKSKRRKKKKKKRHAERTTETKKDSTKRSEPPKETSVDIDIEYVQEVIDVSDPLYFQFMKIFEKFKLTENEKGKEDMATDASKDANKEESINPMALRKKPMDLDDDDEPDEDDKKEEEKPKLSKRKLKKLSRMTVAELKQKVNRPELVEMHDVTAKDPVLLLHLKASRNTVPVPRHWCFKRKYLQGKRGIEKPAFELPDFIKRTGIMEMRQALQEKEDQKTMKAKMRERVRPKLGKIDIDYQKLHDAFFKWQTKPRMTIHGDLYYEGKEFETRLKEKKPGDLSDDLRTALGMPTGPNANKCPPPWLIAMQRYGPPPSYPNLKIPGLNAPIPDSCSFGYHAGGWGKPPVDETGRPLYGDVFGTQITDNQPHIQEEEIDHTLWGELESESSEEEEEDEEDEEEEEEEKAEDESGLVTPAEGLITPSGFSSIPAGMETPDMIELRKRKIEAELEGGETPALYTILPEKKTERVGAAMMGSTHIYDLAAAIPGSKLRMPGTSSVPPQGIEVALDPSELEMDTAAMAARYEQTMREQQSQLEKEDLSDMVAEHAARQKNKRKKQQMDSAKPPKKYKEFKF